MNFCSSHTPFLYPNKEQYHDRKLRITDINALKRTEKLLEQEVELTEKNPLGGINLLGLQDFWENPFLFYNICKIYTRNTVTENKLRIVLQNKTRKRNNRPRDQIGEQSHRLYSPSYQD